MSTRFLLGTVLRVRKLREDQAKAEAAAAQAATGRAVTDHARREAALAGRPAPGTAESAHWLATRSALLAMAGDVVTARELVAVRRAEGTEALARFGGARREREGVEDLADRHAEAVRREREAAAQREADDRAGAAHARARRGDGSDGGEVR